MSWQHAGDVAQRVMAKAKNERLIEALRQIARGRDDNGRALAAESARQIARETLVDLGMNWSGDREEQR